MANNTGKKFGGRTKGTPNKITTEVKNKLVELIDGTISELSTANLNVANKIKLLEIALNYCIPKLSHSYKETNKKQKSFRVEYVSKTDTDVPTNHS